MGLSITDNTVDRDPRGDWWYRHHSTDENYGVYARHGHEYDAANYGNTTNYERAGEIQASFGEAFATEFVVKVPWLARKFTEGGEYDVGDSEGLIARDEEADNLRPLTSVLEWFRRRYGEGDSGKLVDNALEQTMDEFSNIEFVKHWRKSETFWDTAIRAATAPQVRKFTSNFQGFVVRKDLLPLIQ